MITALHLRADGTREQFEYDPLSGLPELQKRVGGYIELVPLMDGQLTMYCNEEGKMVGLPTNSFATILVMMSHQDVIVGDVVLVGAPDDDGYDTSLPQEVLAEFERRWT